MLRENLTQAIEDYLKAIYEITRSDERASTTQIAGRMGVTSASVTGMLKRLAANDPPLLEYHKHHGVELTQEGEQVALEVIRHHRLLELFLHDTLGYTWDEAWPPPRRQPPVPACCFCHGHLLSADIVPA